MHANVSELAVEGGWREWEMEGKKLAGKLGGKGNMKAHLVSC